MPPLLPVLLPGFLPFAIGSLLKVGNTTHHVEDQAAGRWTFEPIVDSAVAESRSLGRNSDSASNPDGVRVFRVFFFALSRKKDHRTIVFAKSQ
jgi:hypothetical protein